MITCVRLPHFAARLEQQIQPALLEHPLALIDTATQRVFDASPEAAGLGVRPGMPVRQAQALCRTLQLQLAAPERARRTFENLLLALTQFSPQVEPEDGLELRADARQRRQVGFVPTAQVDAHAAATCYLDLGTLRDEDTRALVEDIHRTVRAQTGLSAALGVAGGKFPARVAAASLGAGEGVVIPAGQEASFLADFTIELLPVDGETIRQLNLLGLVTLGQIAAQPVGALLDRFGSQGRIMHRLASGRDTSPVLAYAPPVVARRTRELAEPVADWQILHAILDVMVEQLAAELVAEGQAVRHLALVLTLEDGTPREQDLTLRQPSGRAAHLRGTVREMAAALDIPCGVVAVELALSGIAPVVPRQLSLFERAPVEQNHLRAVLDDLVARYGDDCFYRMRLADPDARLPERRYRLERVGR